MSKQLQTLYEKARRETAALLGYKLERLTPEQTTRLDLATALRIGIDDMQGKIVRGKSIDVSKMLAASEALARILPPEVLASPPARDDVDPRKALFETYMEMRRRGELADEINPNSPANRVRALEAENAALRAEVEQLRAAPASPAPVGPAPALAGDNVVTLSCGPKPASATAFVVARSARWSAVVAEARSAGRSLAAASARCAGCEIRRGNADASGRRQQHADSSF